MEDNRVTETTNTLDEAANTASVPGVEKPAEKKGGFFKKKPKEKKSVKQEIKEWVVALGVALIVVLVIQTTLFRIIRVDGHSMDDTLSNGERLFVTVADVRFGGDVPRNSIVICHYPHRGLTYFVKRAVAVPGDTVYRKDGVNHVVYEENGETIDEELDGDIFYNISGVLHSYYGGPDYDPYVLGDNEYFVVGDNRGNSHDSRDWNDNDDSNDVGPITKGMIVGRVRQVIWPLSAWRSAN